MTPDDVRDFVRAHHRGVLATTRADGQPQMSPVLVGVGPNGDLIVSTRESARKTAHVRRAGRAAVCVFTDQFFGAWVHAEGGASVATLPDAMDDLVQYYRDVAGEHPNWDDYRAAMQREQRVLLRIHIERVGPLRQG